jgi:hypothetical protein
VSAAQEGWIPKKERTPATKNTSLFQKLFIFLPFRPGFQVSGISSRTPEKLLGPMLQKSAILYSWVHFRTGNPQKSRDKFKQLYFFSNILEGLFGGGGSTS